MFAVVPFAYRDVAEALHDRTHPTLSAVYVLQVAAALATFLLALPFFAAFGYPFPVTLATVAAVSGSSPWSARASSSWRPITSPSAIRSPPRSSSPSAAFRLRGSPTCSSAPVSRAGRPTCPEASTSWASAAASRPRRRGVVVGPLVVALAVEAAGLLAADLGADPVEPG